MRLGRREMRDRRHLRTRRKVVGSGARPRLSVHFSGQHIYAQVIDDGEGKTLAFVSTRQKALAGLRANVAGASKVGARLAEEARQKGVQKVVFDRGGFLYHGKVEALANAAREAGLEF
ncbi:50S ribosomal protein L18 [Methylacidimicrobium cyclopophantes]|uniref:Large ribosomal subunit protein uL18 n=1 Tax=Methylacidimicrobium cyclopophantes TaxID=1041766 RepID=A0A5E6MC25_9BACT|nr:50S ribosomal protein L18 [Methylacidimicrobium cyclopophantes]VVM05850.1 50S ribosomal protein L18 [Methylacidimicrobium cyclopophantes]